MKGLNQVQLIGNLGKDPEMKFTGTGKAVTSFSLATSRKYRKKDSDTLVEEVEWYTIVTYERLAESVNQALNKGSAVAVTGRLHYQKWEDDKQQKHDRTIIIADDVIFLDKPNGKHDDDIPADQLEAAAPF
jgi:single-strand DNA-binding protein